MEIREIKPYPKNAKKHDKEQVQRVADSIKRFGFVQPIVIDKNNEVVIGHCRLEAGKLLGLTEVPTISVENLIEEEVKALRLADNKLNESAWDMNLAIEDLKELSPEMFDLTGFDKDLLIEPDEADDIIPENVPSVSHLGDLYELGSHKLLCGDSTQQEAVLRLMGDKKARICFTSPPYWVGFAYENESEKTTITEHIEKQAKILKDFVQSKIFINTGNIASLTTAEKITGKKQVVLLIDWWQEALRKSGFLLRHLRIWAKQGGIMPSRANDKSDLHWEYIGNFTTENETAGMIANFYNEDRELQGINKFNATWATKGVWTDIPGTARESGHVASYPIILPLRYFLMYTDRGDLIYDPYGGAGTNIIAAEKVNRKCYMMELDIKYVDVIVQRYVDYTGNEEVIKNGEKIQRKKSEKI